MPLDPLPPASERTSSPPMGNSINPSVNGKVMQINRQLSWRTATSLFNSFSYAWAGLSYAFRTQRNFRVHLFIGALAVSLSIFLNLSRSEIAVIGLTIGAVLAMELLNTAIESVVDLTVKQTYHELAKIAKDCAAAAVLIAAIAAILVAGFLLLPPLVQFLDSVF
jgi:diacylglycerol kinase (ATP)